MSGPVFTEQTSVDGCTTGPSEPLLEQRYNDLLKMIAEVGRDVKPSYTNSKVHADRLKKSSSLSSLSVTLSLSDTLSDHNSPPPLPFIDITSTRAVLRECLLELDRLSRVQLQEEQHAVLKQP